MLNWSNLTVIPKLFWASSQHRIIRLTQAQFPAQNRYAYDSCGIRKVEKSSSLQKNFIAIAQTDLEISQKNHRLLQKNSKNRDKIH
jgi:hypothetical protein